jgi:uncharacterized membrane protein YedE/YeeE
MGLLGGLMIGTAAAIFLLANGRIMGASGLLGGLVDGTGRSNAGERIAFIGALIGVPGLLAWTAGAPETHLSDDTLLLVAAGLLVGVGTRVANGCTSGHGVCGISRLSPRGLAATGVYLFFGALAMLVFRHIMGAI